jgi:uncharacterized phage-associated protein
MATLFDERKAAQVAAFLLFKAGGQLPLIKLVKLMYLAERLSLERYGEPLTGDRLVSMDHGPVLSRTYSHMNGSVECVEGGWDTWIADRSEHTLALKDPSVIRDPAIDLLSLSDADLELLNEIWNQFGHLNKWSLRDYTHGHCPEWKDPEGSSLPISYEDVFRSVGYTADQTLALVTRLNEQKKLRTSFS